MSYLKLKSVVLFLKKTNMENVILIRKSIHNLLLPLFSSWFNLSSETHNYETSWSLHANFHKTSNRTIICDKNSIIVSVVESWNKDQNHIKYISLRFLSTTKIKLLVSNEYKNTELECFCCILFIFIFIVVCTCWL